MSPSDALGWLADAQADCDLAQSGLSLLRLLPKLGVFLERARQVADIREVAPGDVRAWVDSPLPGGRRPSLATRYTRRAAARFGFRLLREARLVDHDPTADVPLPPRGRDREARPLTDDEIHRGRAASVSVLGETRRSTVWALAEATATVSETTRVLATHIDIKKGTVALPGSSRVDPRTGRLSKWGVGVLEHRLSIVESGGDQAVGYDGADRPAASTRTAVTADLARVLTAAGLRSDPAVKVGSVRAWAGHRVLAETGRVDEAARALGCRTLDTAAAIIGFDWRNPQ